MTQRGSPSGEPMANATQGAASDLARLGKPLGLRLTALVLDNFKSFKMKTRIPLRDGFTTISGPNGSGKSNLIDALQFVMGLATSKGMRAGNLTDLICTDSKKNVARVALELEGTFSVTEGPDERIVTRELSICRVVRSTRRGAQAHYELDGEPVRLTDLHDLLRMWGFPTSGQNIVLQGDVVRITSMGPTARRQVLDELAGAKEFDKRIGQAHDELDAADRCTEDTKLILKELAQRLGQLKKERDQALAFQTLTSRRESLERDLVVLDVTEAGLAVRAKAGEVAEAKKVAGKLEDETARLVKDGEAKRKALGELEAELQSKGEGERLTAVRAVESLRARIEGTEDEAKKKLAEREALAERLPALRQDVEEADQGQAALAEQAARLEGAIKEKEAKQQALGGRYEAINETLRKNSAAQIEASQRGVEVRRELEAARARERELYEKQRELGEQVSRKEAELAHLDESGQELSARRSDLQTRAEAASEAFRARREAVAECTERRRKLHRQLQELRSGLEAVASKVSRAEQEVAAAEARRQQAHLLSGGQALAYLKETNMRGLHGQVAELVDFDTQYAAALEAAAGGRLRWVVVDDEHVAKKGIDLLKRNGVGRLSFAPLTKMKAPPRDKSAPRGKAILGFAIDLVSAERRYDAVLESVFGNTLVVESLRDALPLIGRYRMVTLDGDILERGGLMSGGAASRTSRLLMATAKAAEEVEERQRAVEELEKQRSAARGSLRKVEGEFEQVSRELAKLESELAGTKTETASLNAELTRLEELHAPQVERIDGLTGGLEEARKGLAEVEAELAGIRKAVAEKGERLDGFDEPTGDASQRFEELNRQGKELEAQLHAIGAELGQLRQQHGTVTGELRAAEERAKAARQAVTDAEARIEALAGEAEAVAGQVEGLQAELKEKEAALEALSGELMALARRRDEARQAAEAARDALNRARMEAENLAERREALAAQLAELEAKAGELRRVAEEQDVEVPDLDEAPADLEKSRKRLEGLVAKIDRELETIGPVNQLAIEQYDEALERHEELEGKINELEEEKNGIRSRIVDLEGKKKTAFLDAFQLVEDAFARTFMELARGEGRLRLEDKKDPFAGGLIIEARPRGKKLTRLEAMSGGEKTLTALAFIFALQEVNPAPFFVFDEVDAALDGVNTEVVAEAVRRRAADRQYVVISHRRVALDKSNQTIGVSMRRGYGTVVTGIPIEEAAGAEAEAEAVEVAS